jgi:TonB family protein
MTTPEDVLLPDVYSAGEVARAAAVSVRDAEDALESAGARPFPGGYYRTRDAVAAVRRLTAASVPAGRGDQLFVPPPAPRRARVAPLAAAGAVHVVLVALLMLAAAMQTGVVSGETDLDASRTRLIFLAAPGPGGGGGGGGRREPEAPAPATMKGADPLPSPVPVRRPPPPVRPRVVHAVAPPPVPAEPLPPVLAPVVPAAADSRDRVGLPIETAERPPSHGPGTDGSVGTGRGGGLGEGAGAGLGPGSGGGTGGGPYRAGSGITPPAILREVKPDYTEEGRRREIEGDVVLEIVVRHDGTVADVTLLQGLGAGLDQRAMDAVRQWRFSPATRLGTPVDVIVQVAVEFRLR